MQLQDLPLFLDGSDGSMWKLSLSEWKAILDDPTGELASRRYVPAAAVVAYLHSIGALKVEPVGTAR
jgi:hypothetical protein